MNKIRSIIGLGCIFFFAVLGSNWRLTDLEKCGLWSDELFTASLAENNPIIPQQGPLFRRALPLQVNESDSFLTAKGADLSPPLYELLAKVALSVFGPSDTSIRLPSAISAVLLIAYIVAKYLNSKIVEQKNFYLLIISLLAPCSAYIEYAHEARAYSLMILFCSVIHIEAIERILRYKPISGPTPVIVIISFGLAYIANYTCIISLFPLFVFFFICAIKGNSRRREILKLISPFIFIAAWAPFCYHTIRATSSGNYSRALPPPVHEIIAAAFSAFKQLLSSSMLSIGALSLLLLFSALVIGRKSNIKDLIPARLLWLLVYGILILVFIIATSAYAASKMGFYHPRYFLLALFPFIALISAIIVIVAKNNSLLYFISILGFTIGALSINYYPIKQKEGYRECAAWIASKSSGDILVLSTWGPNHSFYEYYLRRFFSSHTHYSISTIDDFTNNLPAIKTRPFFIFYHLTHKGFVEEIQKKHIDSLIKDGQFEVLSLGVAKFTIN